MAGHGMSHCQPKQPLMLRLIELFSTSQDVIYGDSHVDRTSETLDGTADHEMLSYPPRQSAAPRLVDSFSVVTFLLCFLLTPVTPQVALRLLAIFHIDNTHVDGYRY